MAMKFPLKLPRRSRSSQMDHTCGDRRLKTECFKTQVERLTIHTSVHLLNASVYSYKNLISILDVEIESTSCTKLEAPLWISQKF